MKNVVIKVHPSDNIIIALQNFSAGDEIYFKGKRIQLLEDIPVICGTRFRRRVHHYDVWS